MPPDFIRQTGHTRRRIRLQTPLDPTEPRGCGTPPLGGAAFDQPAQGGTQLLLGYIAVAPLRQQACQRSAAAADPPLHGHVRIAGALEPRRIELDLDLLESRRGYVVAVGRPRPIENRRWAGNRQLA